MFQANRNKQNEFDRAQGNMYGAQGLSGQLNSNAQNTAAMGQGLGKAVGAAGMGVGNLATGGLDWGDVFGKKKV